MRKLNLHLLLFIFLSSCATRPTSQIASLTDSLSTLSKDIDEVFNEFVSSSYERQFTDLATLTGEHIKKINSKSFEEIKSPFDGTNRNKLPVIRASQALTSYIKNLNLLATGSSKESINKSAIGISSSFKNMNNHYKNFSDNKTNLLGEEELGTLTALAANVFNLSIEKERDDTIKKIMITSDPKIAIICNEIIKQLKDSRISKAIKSSRKTILAEEIRDYKKQISSFKSLRERRKAIEQLYNSSLKVDSALLIVNRLINRLNLIKTIHSDATSKIKNNRLDSKAIIILVQKAKDFSKDYKNLKESL